MSSGSSQELLSGSGAESTWGENKIRTTLSDCNGRVVSALSSKGVMEQAACSLAPTCMSSRDASPNTDNNSPVLIDINKASGICSARTTAMPVTTCTNVCDMDLNTPDAGLRNVLCDSSNCSDETVISSGDAEVCGSPTTIRHLCLVNEGMLLETTASQIKGSSSAASSMEKPRDDVSSNIKMTTLSVCVS